jgi:dipeptidyl aminopeptidase/acylaminoacyl peptidase
MMKLLVTALVALASLPQQAPPATDVYLAALSSSGGSITVGKPQNISESPGYDNQPSFAPDGRSLFFTSAREPMAGASQMDIFRYELQSRQITRVTTTAESEYSATVTPDGQHISVIRVEKDGLQRLWKFPLAGQAPSLVFENVEPVGYHAWLDADRIAMFVLGKPATLQLGDVRTGKADTLVKNIGRSLQRMPGGGVSFVRQDGQGAERRLMISELVLENGQPATRPLVAAVAGAREADVAWMPDGTLLMAHAGSLHAWKKGRSEWRVVADLGALGLKDVSRLAVSPKGDHIAMVASQ